MGCSPWAPCRTSSWGDVDGAVALTTGTRFCLARPDPNAATRQVCVDALAQAVAGRWNSLLLDNRGAHTAPRLLWPEPVRSVWGPPSGPERNPIARVWRDLKDQVAWKSCPDLETLQDAGGISSGPMRPPPINPLPAIPLVWRPFMHCVYNEVILQPLKVATAPTLSVQPEDGFTRKR